MTIVDVSVIGIVVLTAVNIVLFGLILLCTVAVQNWKIEAEKEVKAIKKVLTMLTPPSQAAGRFICVTHRQ